MSGSAPHIPAVMVPNRDFMMFKLAGDRRMHFWFRCCPICGLRIAEPADSPDEVRIVDVDAASGTYAGAACCLHGRCGRAVELRGDDSDGRYQLVRLAFLRALESLGRSEKLYGKHLQARPSVRHRRGGPGA